LKRISIVAALAALLVIVAIPVAFAQDRDDRQEDRFDERQERFEDHGFFFFGDEDEDRFDGNDFDFDNGSGIAQDFEQEAESGDVNQSFDVSSTGDNSNQCAGIQGVANTGNAQNQTGLIQYGSEADDFEFDEVGSTIEVSPENTTTCDQQVNQAASAFGS
jgi:hypothetical protein